MNDIPIVLIRICEISEIIIITGLAISKTVAQWLEMMDLSP